MPISETDFEWYYSRDEETWFTAGDRDEAIEGLDGDLGWVGEHSKWSLKLSKFVNFEWLLETIFDSMNEDYGGEDWTIGDNVNLTGLETKILGAFDEWQGERGVVISSYYFASSRNVERVNDV